MRRLELARSGRSLAAAAALSCCLPAAGCTRVAAAEQAAERGQLVVLIRLGGLCAHERFPGDPECVPQPQPGVRVVIRSAEGAPVTTLTSGPDGTAEIALAPGDYQVEGLPDPRFFVTARPARVTIQAARSERVTLTYNTGIQ